MDLLATCGGDWTDLLPAMLDIAAWLQHVATMLRDWGWALMLKSIQTALRRDANEHYHRIAAEVGDAWSQLQTKKAFARLRGMGVGSPKKLMMATPPTVRKLDGSMAVDHHEMGDRWL